MVDLNEEQLKRLSEFIANLGLVFFGTAVIPPIFTPLDRIDPFMITLGMLLTLYCLTVSLFLLRERGNGFYYKS